MIFNECKTCEKNTFFMFEEYEGCINEDCENINWEIKLEYKELIFFRISKILKLCGCGNPKGVINFFKEFLDLKTFLSNKKITWSEYYTKQKKLFETNLENLMWFVEYFLDDGGITGHGGNVSGSWLIDFELKELLDIYCE